jgi:hypothetical protein
MLVLSALIVPIGLLVLMLAMQRVQERLLPTPVAPLMPAAVVNDVQAFDAVPVIDEVPAVIVSIPAQGGYESSESVVGNASLTSASPSR